MKSGNSSFEIQNWEQMVTVWWVLMSSDFHYNAFILVVNCYLLLSGLIAFPSSFHLPRRIVVLCVKTKVTIFRAFNFQLGICHKILHCCLDGWINFFVFATFILAYSLLLWLKTSRSERSFKLKGAKYPPWIAKLHPSFHSESLTSLQIPSVWRQEDLVFCGCRCSARG